ncbi:hypothetical protein CDV52_09345 [Haematobacter missouriensis]|uniref:Uncharacterized protein n=1 Tax=Haematobacter missouriensis TaxID=366616 RepID=A0A212ARD1_9RHOB|nr:hypothetical protein CDV52_09345 [Haematobacter missouriensis]
MGAPQGMSPGAMATSRLAAFDMIDRWSGPAGLDGGKGASWLTGASVLRVCVSGWLTHDSLPDSPDLPRGSDALPSRATTHAVEEYRPNSPKFFQIDGCALEILATQIPERS